MPFSTASELASDVWVRGVEFLGNGDLVRAADCFEHVLEYDARAADAWLGLHACGEQQEEALLHMIEHHADMGKLRTTTGLALASSFSIGWFVAGPLTEADHAWLAHVALLIDQERFDQAREQLADTTTDDEPVRFLRLRCAFAMEEWEQVLRDSHGGFEDPMFNDEVQLYVAASLLHLETFHEALDVLDGIPAVLNVPQCDAQACFLRGSALEALGQPKEAAQAFQRAYRLAPEVKEFAERAGAYRQTEKSAKAPERARPQADAEVEPDAANRSALLEDAAKQLDAMIGLKPVKDQIQTLKAQFRMAALKKERGLTASTRPQHFVFTGPPGTGKTTVARIMGEILAGLGLLEHGKVVETQRGDLVGQFLGQTAQKTREKIEEATGGVLFIDEAYSLANQGYTGDGDAFGDEAMQEILTAAENRRDRLVIVLAGYTDEIHELLSTNPGLRSRFSTVIDFPSYAAEELIEIAAAILAAAGEGLTSDAERALLERFEAVIRAGAIDDLGNARFARELSLKAGARRDLRLIEAYGDSGVPTTEEMTTIETADVEHAFRELTSGFRPN